MIEFQNLWPRLQESIVQETIQSTFANLETKLSLKTLAIVDPQMNWFNKWFICQLGRKMITPILHETEFIHRICLYLLQTIDKLAIGNFNLPMCLDPDHLKIIHILCMIGKLLYHSTLALDIQIYGFTPTSSWLLECFSSHLNYSHPICLESKTMIKIFLQLMLYFPDIGSFISHDKIQSQFSFGRIIFSILKDIAMSPRSFCLYQVIN